MKFWKLWVKLHCSKYSYPEKMPVRVERKKKTKKHLSKLDNPRHEAFVITSVSNTSATAPTFVLEADFTEDRAKT